MGTIIEDIDKEILNKEVRYEYICSPTSDFLLECIDPTTGEARFITNSRKQYFRMQGTVFKIDEINKLVTWLDVCSEPFIFQDLNRDNIWERFESKVGAII